MFLPIWFFLVVAFVPPEVHAIATNDPCLHAQPASPYSLSPCLGAGVKPVTP